MKAKDPLVEQASDSGSAARPVSTSLARPPAGSPTGSGSAILRVDEGLLLRLAEKPQDEKRTATSSTGSPASSASRATPTAPATPSTSRSARATPSSPRCSWLAAYAAIANGGTLTQPRVAKAIVSPDGRWSGGSRQKGGRVGVPDRCWPTSTGPAGGHPVGHAGLEARLPVRPRVLRGKTGSAEVYGKQSTGWVATYTEDSVVVMMISQAAPAPARRVTACARSGRRVRRRRRDRRPAQGRDPRDGAARGAAVLQPGRLDLPPPARRTEDDRPHRLPAPPHRPVPPGRLVRVGCPGSTWTCCCSARSSLLSFVGTCRWSATMHRDDLTGGDPTAYLRQAGRQRRHRPRADRRRDHDRPPLGPDPPPLVYLARCSAWCWCW